MAQIKSRWNSPICKAENSFRRPSFKFYQEQPPGSFDQAACRNGDGESRGFKSVCERRRREISGALINIESKSIKSSN